MVISLEVGIALVVFLSGVIATIGRLLLSSKDTQIAQQKAQFEAQILQERAIQESRYSDLKVEC
jgi:Flp pilus assembly protein protease CpaA